MSEEILEVPDEAPRRSLGRRFAHDSEVPLHHHLPHGHNAHAGGQNGTYVPGNRRSSRASRLSRGSLGSRPPGLVLLDEAQQKAERARMRASLAAVLPGQEFVQHHHGERRKPGFDAWRGKFFHPGARVDPMTPSKVPAWGAPAASLAEWLSSHNFESSILAGSLFGGGLAPPEGYEAAFDEAGLPWLWHARTRVAIWPVRADLGCCGSNSNEEYGGEGSGDVNGETAVTLYHYTSGEGMHRLTKVLFQGDGPLALLDALRADGGLAGTGHSLICTVMEPAHYARRRDVLWDRLGPDRWPPRDPEELDAASHCLPFALPLAALTRCAGAGRSRPDRLQVLDGKLRQRLREGAEAAAAARRRGRGSAVPIRGLALLTRLFGGRSRQLSKEEILARTRLVRLRAELERAVRAREEPLRLANAGLRRRGRRRPPPSEGGSGEGSGIGEEEASSGSSSGSEEEDASDSQSSTAFTP